MCGCAALEHSTPDVATLQRLAILPRFRRCGFGRALVSHVLNVARVAKAQELRIAVIAKHTDLVAWYERQGFSIVGEREFPHLPFVVTYLRRQLSAESAAFYGGESVKPSSVDAGGE